jgi:predicted membrane-bound mannosyltransferase
MKVEAPILILSALSILVAILRGKNGFAMFTALWAFGLFAAYSIIPYKTPWLALSFILPMCLVAGYGLAELIASKQMRLRIAGIALAGLGSLVLAYQSYQLNFVRYDDEEMAYVYAHTRRQFLDMVAEIHRYAEKSGRGPEATVEIVSPDYWPLTWYLVDYKHANFHGSLVDANTAEILVAKKTDQDAAVIQRYSAHYKFAGVWPLRPGVDLMLLVRKDLADRDDQELYKIPEAPTSR